MMENRFEIESTHDVAIADDWIVRDKKEGWFVPCTSKIQAEMICEKLNEVNVINTEKRVLTIPHDEKLDLHSDFIEWNNLINWINESSRRISELDEIYKEEFKIELQNAIEDGVDFKAIYGGNTEKTRKQYVDEQLSDLLVEKNELEFLKADDIRRIDFLRHLIKMKTELLKIDKGVEL